MHLQERHLIQTCLKRKWFNIRLQNVPYIFLHLKVPFIWLLVWQIINKIQIFVWRPQLVKFWQLKHKGKVIMYHKSKIFAIFFKSSIFFQLFRLFRHICKLILGGSTYLSDNPTTQILNDIEGLNWWESNEDLNKLYIGLTGLSYASEDREIQVNTKNINHFQ